jgi:hypothetical protein
MKVTVLVELGERTVVEQITTKEDFRGDYRRAISECASRVELSTFGPQLSAEGHNFDEQLKMGHQV